ncbi:MAG: Ig-like domain-containing protein [Chitinophagaceae bacterium]
MKNSLLYLLVILLFLKFLFLSSGCANIIPPSGGPRDTLPPQLLQVTPKDSSLNFTEKRITFSFNEFVDVQNIQDNLIVSPTLKTYPVVEFKLRTVTVRIKDTLDANTTYSLNFGNAIRDINEGNELKNYTYVFSTGTTIDNKQFAGHVIIAETGKIDSTLIVLLHRSADDSALVKERPRYYTRLDGKGNFVFRNLPSGTFYAYTLKDESSNRRYMSTAQLFGFAEKPIIISENTTPDTLFAYIEKLEEPKKAPTPIVSVKEKNTPDRRLIFQTNLDGNQQDLLNSFSLQFSSSLKVFDSTKVVFADYSFQPLKVSFIPDSAFKKFTFIYSWQPDSTYHLILDKSFAEDSTGKKLLKSDTITFKSKKLTDYARIRLRFPRLDLSKNPVLQFVQSDKVVDSSILVTQEFNRQLFKPGDYDLRIVYDRNKNGKWDPGSFFGKHLQPEKVLLIPQQLKVKGGIDRDDRFDF